MQRRLSRGCSHRPGFTVAELLVSVMILGLISVATVTSLVTSQQADQLATAARVLAADLRAQQSGAITAQNLKTCTDASAKKIVCENSTAACTDACTSLPPYGIGLHLTKTSSTYDFFGDVDASKNEWKETDATEVIKRRAFASVGGQNVVVDDLITTASQPSIDVAFQRQNGTMVIDGCSGACASPVSLRIVLRHTVSNATTEVDLNSYTGRISIP